MSLHIIYSMYWYDLKPVKTDEKNIGAPKRPNSFLPLNCPFFQFYY